MNGTGRDREGNHSRFGDCQVRMLRLLRSPVRSSSTVRLFLARRYVFILILSFAIAVRPHDFCEAIRDCCMGCDRISRQACL